MLLSTCPGIWSSLEIMGTKVQICARKPPIVPGNGGEKVTSGLECLLLKCAHQLNK